MSQDVQPVAVVTGASSGIGFETAKALTTAGWWVIAVGASQSVVLPSSRN